mgnify:CR=1 FL=1
MTVAPLRSCAAGAAARAGLCARDGLRPRFPQRCWCFLLGSVAGSRNVALHARPSREPRLFATGGLGKRGISMTSHVLPGKRTIARWRTGFARVIAADICPWFWRGPACRPRVRTTRYGDALLITAWKRGTIHAGIDGDQARAATTHAAIRSSRARFNTAAPSNRPCNCFRLSRRVWLIAGATEQDRRWLWPSRELTCAGSVTEIRIERVSNRRWDDLLRRKYDDRCRSYAGCPRCRIRRGTPTAEPSWPVTRSSTSRKRAATGRSSSSPARCSGVWRDRGDTSSISTQLGRLTARGFVLRVLDNPGAENVPQAENPALHWMFGAVQLRRWNAPAVEGCQPTAS